MKTINCASFAMLVVLGGCQPPPNSAAANSGTPVTNETVAEPAADNTITMAEYNQLETGMSYAQVVEVHGFQGTEQTSSDMGVIRTAIYAWANPDGMENLNVTFQNDKLVMKAQFGLR